METLRFAQVRDLGLSFNFLASLINGNDQHHHESKPQTLSFNFLASLINGNKPKPKLETEFSSCF